MVLDKGFHPCHELLHAMTSRIKALGSSWLVPGDFDGFFALFFSSMPDLLLIAGLGTICGFSLEFITRQILPAVALSILAGNFFYAWKARQLAQRTGREDVTAIPFGVNTPTIFAYIFLIMLPVYQRTHDSNLSWQVGVCACFLSGLIQTGGAFCTDWLRRHTPRAALLCPLAGIAMAFLCLGFILRVFQAPEIALLPTVVLLALYSSHLRLPFRLPAGLLGILTGIGLVWGLKVLGLYHLPEPPPLSPPAFHPPVPVAFWTFLTQGEGWKYLSVILPMGILDTLVSLQILESVKIAGDDYETRPVLLFNGLATLGAAAFGSPFPTILYFGHTANKALGARAGYSILNGLCIGVICMGGIIPFILHFIPLEIVAIFVVWVGLAAIGQAFTEVPSRHAIAVAFGLIPVLASWALGLIETAVIKSGSSLALVAPLLGDELPIRGLIALGQGAVLVSMLWAAAMAYLIDRRFLQAGGWLLAGALLSFFGFIHSYQLTATGIYNPLGIDVAPEFFSAYLLSACFLFGCHFYSRSKYLPPQPAP